MTTALTADDPRYRRMFDVSHEARSAAGRVEGDLTPAMSALRDQAPVHHGSLRQLLSIPETHKQYDNERDHYTVFSFDLCEKAFRENLLFSSEVYKESPGVRSMGKVILAMVGEEHRRYRGLVQPMFRRPMAATWWKTNWINDAVDALVGRMDGWEIADLNMELCARLPVYVVTRGIGMSGEDALTFRDHLLKATLGVRTLPHEEWAHASAEVSRMLKDLIAERRRTPGDDVITGLANAELKLDDGGTRKLDDEEVFSYCRLIMLAGGGTTWRQLGITLHAILNEPRWWRACLEDRELVEKAVEESLRWMPTDPIFARLLTADVELAGVKLPAGARVDVCLGAGNRDPSRWHDPDVYDPTRPSAYHLGFSIGPHQCLGMNVAKQEMITAINRLLDRFPAMHLDPAAAPAELKGGLEQRGMSAIEVRLH